MSFHIGSTTCSPAPKEAKADRKGVRLSGSEKASGDALPFVWSLHRVTMWRLVRRAVHRADTRDLTACATVSACAPR